MNPTFLLPTGDTLLLVSVPKDATDIWFNEERSEIVFTSKIQDPNKIGGDWIEVPDIKNASILGTYSPSDNTIDLEPSRDFVELVAHQPAARHGVLLTPEIKLYRNYKYSVPQIVDVTYGTAGESFLSLLRQRPMGGVCPRCNGMMEEEYF